MSELDGRTALISGAGRGIGAATALRLAKEGARVIVSDILEDVGQRTTREIKATGAKAVFVRLDVTKEVDWNAACETAKAQFGELDILVNNAGVVLPRSMEETTLDEWRRQQSVNVEGVFLGTRICTPLLRVGGNRWPGGAAIVNVSSVAGLTGSPRVPAYSATKGAVSLFTKSTALEYGQKRYPIRVNSVHPGVIDTEMGQTVVNLLKERMATDEEKARAMLISAHPIGRMGKPEEVAAAIVFLCSDEASFFTGSELIVDGGYTAQ
jgi:3(or 17)beta-hydroxysteroid dehydrogenase